MTIKHRKWYTPSGALLRLVRWILHQIKTPKPEQIIILCALYGMIDLYGAVHTPALCVWLISKLKEKENAGKEKSNLS